MAKDLEINDLEVSVETQETTSKAKKELSAEEIQALRDANEKIRQFGVSENFSKVMEMVPMWHDTEANAATKQSVIDAFGGSDKLKDYIDGEFQDELAVIAGLAKSASILNNIKSFYARRASSGTKKVKTTIVNIAGTPYNVNSEYLASLTGVEAEEKRALLLAHADTKTVEAVEVL